MVTKLPIPVPKIPIILQPAKYPAWDWAQHPCYSQTCAIDRNLQFLAWARSVPPNTPVMNSARLVGRAGSFRGTMGLFDLFGSSSDTDVGNQVLSAYFTEAQNFPEFGFQDYDSWIAALKAKVSDIVETVGGLVKANSASTTTGQAQDRLTQLANTSGGQATIPQIVAAAGGSGNTVNLLAAIPDVASATASQVASGVVTGAQSVGQGVLSTLSVGNVLVKYLPITLLVAGGLWLYFEGKQLKRML